MLSDVHVDLASTGLSFPLKNGLRLFLPHKEPKTVMSTDENNQNASEAQIAGEGQEVDAQEETIAISKSEFEKLNQTIGSLKRENKDLKKPKEDATPQKTEKTGELDENALLYLEVKGVKTDDADELSLVEKWRSDSGKSVKDIHASKIFQAELKELRDTKAVQDATPSATKRGGGQVGDVAAAIAKFEATGDLPADFALRSAVVNKMEERSSASTPSWRR